MSHDQNFKNLILDYPRQAVELFAPLEAASIHDPEVRILPVREEQLQERLGERFRELDTPLLVEWPDQRREALLFLFEEETKTRRFSVRRLIHYCVDISELLDTERIVPIVIFLHGEAKSRCFRLSGDAKVYLDFHYLAYAFGSQNAKDHLDSPNLIARLNLPNMRYSPADRVHVYARAVQGLLALESDTERQIKYLDFIDIYTQLSEEERMIYTTQYAQDAAVVTNFARRFVQQGESAMLERMLVKRFGRLDTVLQTRLRQATNEQLEHWGEQFVDAKSLDEVFRDD
ncbi:hypothetical protein Thiowin_02951 [Thiorhodovibrio winogradskyi]|uniref:DUF4351 domain-containing protein n=1 Tax=Thiorhodovibrio winogradskyi TaxID=77007 RepID=A0ABZ0SC50_9GAMM|nr:DUF4351 domain-containing protein [Thiorhodovibrio winogradskyi]